MPMPQPDVPPKPPRPPRVRVKKPKVDKPFRAKPANPGAKERPPAFRAERPTSYPVLPYEDKTAHNLGPDMPAGRSMPHLPTLEQIPPKPTEPPEMVWPGFPYPKDGRPEWCLWTPVPGNEEGLDPSISQWRVRWAPPNDRRCVARSVGKTTPWRGNRCNLTPVKGAKVCRYHGGNLPAVQKAAKTALAMAAMPAAEHLIHIAIKKRGVKDADRIKALIEILNRAGVEGKATVEIELKPWQQALQSVYTAVTGSTDVDDEMAATITLEEGVDYVIEEDEAPEDWELDGDGTE